jgi:hypothetical protein
MIATTQELTQDAANSATNDVYDKSELETSAILSSFLLNFFKKSSLTLSKHSVQQSV